MKKLIILLATLLSTNALSAVELEVLTGKSGYHVLFSSADSVVVTYTMGTGQRPSEDKTNAQAACGENESILKRYFQVATKPGGDHGKRTYVVVCKK